jgi:hypothetical protein
VEASSTHEDPSHSNESTTGREVVVGVGGVDGLDRGSDAEGDGGDQVGDDQRLSSTELVDEGDTASLSDEGKDGVDRLEEQSHLGLEANGGEDGGRVVLEDGDTGHLDGELEDRREGGEKRSRVSSNIAKTSK